MNFLKRVIKTIFIILIILFIFISQNAFAHTQWLHQYITQEAFKLLQKSYPNHLAEMSQYVGTWETENNDHFSWGAFKIVSGAWIEDEYDVVYHYGIGEKPNFIVGEPSNWQEIFYNERKAYVSVTHFWDADLGPDARVRLVDDPINYLFLIDCENSYQKMKSYQNGAYYFWWLWKQLTTHICSNITINRVEADEFSIPSLLELYNGIGEFYATRHRNIISQWSESYGCPTNPSSSFDVGYVYEILGRMCHLLQDMSVPAHVHCHSHACAAGQYCDYYEQNELDFNHPTANEIWNSGGTYINPYYSEYPYNDPIYFLMYFMNQITDHYADGSINGDDDYDPDCPMLSDIIPNLGLPTIASQVNDQNCRSMHSILTSFVIRATAGLMYWFACETGQLPTPNPTTTGELSNNEWWEGTINLTGNVTVPNGVTLTILNNANVYLNNYYIKCEGSGKIVKQGTVSGYQIYARSGNDYKGFFPYQLPYLSLQQIINWASSGWNIYIGEHTYNENLNMKGGVSISGCSFDPNRSVINGNINFNNDGAGGLNGLRVNGKIDLDYSDWVTFRNIKQVYTGSTDLELYDSALDIYDYYYSDQSKYHGIYVHTNSDLTMEDGDISNKGIALMVISSSDATAAYTTFCTNGTDIIASQGSSVYANNCSFSSSTPWGSVSGDVSWNSWSYCGGMAKVAAFPVAEIPHAAAVTIQEDETDGDPASKDYSEAKEIWQTVKAALKQDLRSDKGYNPQNYAYDIRKAADRFKEVVSMYPSSDYAAISLGFIARAHRLLNEYTELTDYVDHLTGNKNYQDLVPQALNVLIASHIDQEQYKEAIALSDKIIDMAPRNDLSCELLYGKGLIYKNYLEDYDNAAEMFRQVVARFPDHPTSFLATERLEEMKGKSIEKDVVEATKKPSEFTANSYPNPFNPETSIQFTLPDQGRVVLKIFDILGREVITLVNQERPAGAYEVQWNGKDARGQKAASGTYFYQVRFKDKVVNRKVLLIK